MSGWRVVVLPTGIWVRIGGKPLRFRPNPGWMCVVFPSVS